MDNIVFGVRTTTFFFFDKQYAIETKIESPKLDRKYTDGY